jgi:hypothetical protein
MALACWIYTAAHHAQEHIGEKTLEKASLLTGSMAMAWHEQVGITRKSLSNYIHFLITSYCGLRMANHDHAQNFHRLGAVGLAVLDGEC